MTEVNHGLPEQHALMNRHIKLSLNKAECATALLLHSQYDSRHSSLVHLL